MIRKNLTGKTFSRLFVISIAGKDRWGHYKYNCRCECGREIVIVAGSLRSGNTTQCSNCKNTVHNLRYTPEYSVWSGIKQRCYNTNSNNYKNYGGRGIIVCDRWLESFENFYMDMGPRPSENWSIERIDNNGNYELSNCRWATMLEQSRNRRINGSD